MQHFVDLIPRQLHDISGAVFNSGRDAYSRHAALYLLGLNPGGDPEKHVAETVKSHTTKVLSGRSNWCAHRDESWDGRPPGSYRMQPHVLHMLRQLRLDPGEVPSSNVAFARTVNAKQLEGDLQSLAELCWPLHAAVIDQLQVKTILCFGQDAGKFVQAKIGAHRHVGIFVENNNRRWQSNAYENDAGVAVVVATHPSRASWINPQADPTPLIQAVMSRSIERNPSAPSIPSLRHLNASYQPEASHADRSAQLVEVFQASGLNKILASNGVRRPPDENYTKLRVIPNVFRIRSIELHELHRGGCFFRVHYAKDAPEWLLNSLRSLPGVRTSTSSGTNFDGDPLGHATTLANFLKSKL